MLAAADVLVIALPLTNATRGLIGGRELSLMKSAAILVNVGRAAIVDERARYEHLRSQPDFCAGIDAWWHEPGPGSEFSTRYPFFELPNLLGSPHNSGVTDGALNVGVRQAAENVRRFLAGEAVIGVARPGDYLELAHRGLEVVVADGAAGYAGRTRAGLALVEHEDVFARAQSAGP